MRATKRFPALFAVVAALLASAAAAAPAAIVDALVTPAWLERKGRTEPLALGMEIRNGDRIRTGDGARVYLKLAEGSTVKLGADAGIGFFSRSLRPQRDFKAALDLLGGAFRFTTDALSRVRSRDVAIRVGTATAGIRGTDVWGRTTAEEDLVCLLDGRIEVAHAGLAEPVVLSEPLSYAVVPKGQALKLAKVDAAEMQTWARATEILAGDGAQRRGGKWKLSLGAQPSEAAALETYDLLRGAGFAPKIAPQMLESGGWSYEVLLPGFADEEDALRAAARLRAAAGLEAVPQR